MIKTIEIEHFRGIRHAKIDGLKGVNIFFGYQACRYLSPKYDFYTSIESLTEILKNKDEQFILEALRIIEPMIKDIVLSQNEVLVDVGLNKRII